MPVPDRRTFLMQTGKLLVMTASAAAAWDYVMANEPEKAPGYDATAHWWAMIIDVEKCIGCGLCVTLGNPTAPQVREFGCPPDYDAINMMPFDVVVKVLESTDKEETTTSPAAFL